MQTVQHLLVYQTVDLYQLAYDCLLLGVRSSTNQGYLDMVEMARQALISSGDTHQKFKGRCLATLRTQQIIMLAGSLGTPFEPFISMAFWCPKRLQSVPHQHRSQYLAGMFSAAQVPRPFPAIWCPKHQAFWFQDLRQVGAPQLGKHPISCRK